MTRVSVKREVTYAYDTGLLPPPMEQDTEDLMGCSSFCIVYLYFSKIVDPIVATSHI